MQWRKTIRNLQMVTLVHWDDSAPATSGTGIQNMLMLCTSLHLEALVLKYEMWYVITKSLTHWQSLKGKYLWGINSVPGSNTWWNALTHICCIYSSINFTFTCEINALRSKLKINWVAHLYIAVRHEEWFNASYNKNVSYHQTSTLKYRN